MGASVYRITDAGGGAVAVSAEVPAGMAYRVISVGAHFSAAPTTAGSLTVTLDAKEGSEYDTLLQTASMVGITDWLWQPDQDLILVAGDQVDVAYANPDARTYGVRVTLKAV